MNKISIGFLSLYNTSKKFKVKTTPIKFLLIVFLNVFYGRCVLFCKILWKINENIFVEVLKIFSVSKILSQSSLLDSFLTSVEPF